MAKNYFLLRELVKRDFQSRYIGSLLGFLWAFLIPFWQLLLYSFVFSTVMKISLVGERTESFAAFMFCGMLPWIAINDGLVRSATAITDNAQLVKKMSLPSRVLVLAAILGGVIHELVAAVVFVLVLAWTGELNWSGIPFLLILLPLQISLTLGLGQLLCCIHTIFRDTAQALSLVLTAWFFLTPIVYPLGALESVPTPFKEILMWNPLTILVTLYRQALLAGGDADLSIAWGTGLGKLALLAGVAMWLGTKLFRRLSPSFADEI